MTRELMQAVTERGSCSKTPVHKRPRTTRYDPTTKLVGQAFERNMKDVCSWLLNDEVSCIGIYGMGGVGKKTSAIHDLLDQLQEKPDIFPRGYWITESREFSVHALQDLIANAFGLRLQNGKDVMMIRARELWTALSVIKCILILDNLWGHFLPDEVGIPLRTDRSKLILTTRSLDICRRMDCPRILTTRSLDICRRMDCPRIIKVEPLSEGEAWNLFIDESRHGNETDCRVCCEVVCWFAPLGIMTMARSVKREWMVNILLLSSLFFTTSTV